MGTYRRIVVEHRGGPEVLQIAEEELRDPAAGEARVRVLAAGVSGMDRMVRASSFPGFSKPPFTPGCDLVGVVDAVADDVGSAAIGDLVAAGPFPEGGYTECWYGPADGLVPVPDGVDPVDAVCLVANYLTAHQMLHEVAQVEPGDRVLIHGAAGGVGTAMLELGSLAGLEMYGTASKRNQDFVQSHGATPIDYRNDDFVERIHELTGGGVDVVFDPIGGGRQLWRSSRALRPGGMLVWFGVAASTRSGVWVIPSSLIGRLVVDVWPNGKSAPLTPRAEATWCRETLPGLFDLLAAGKVSPIVADRIPLVEAPRAHEMLERGGVRGKLVLICDSPSK